MTLVRYGRGEQEEVTAAFSQTTRLHREEPWETESPGGPLDVQGRQPVSSHLQARKSESAREPNREREQERERETDTYAHTLGETNGYGHTWRANKDRVLSLLTHMRAHTGRRRTESINSASGFRAEQCSQLHELNEC